MLTDYKHDHETLSMNQSHNNMTIIVLNYGDRKKNNWAMVKFALTRTTITNNKNDDIPSKRILREEKRKK